jgi:energy-coupling factor transporter ATP-binding protein EcfA2
MRFTRLKLSCWRNFPSAQVTLGERALIFGPNGAGKSNLLDALRFLSEVASPGGGLWNAAQRRDPRMLPSMQGSGGDVKVEVEAEISGEVWGYGLAFQVDKQGVPRVRAETVRQGRRKLLRRPEAEDRREPGRLAQTHLEQSSASAAFGPLLEGLRSVRSVAGPLATGGFTSALLATPRRPREARMRRVLELLRGVLPRLDRWSLDHDEQGVPRFALRMDRGRLATWHPEGLLSASTMHLLHLLWEASDEQGPLLLEEPERGLHPELVGQLLALLKSVAPRAGRQLLICTHAERLLDDSDVAPSEILLLHPSAEGTRVESAAEDTQVRSVAAEEGPIGPLIAARTGASVEGQIPLFFGGTP